MIRRLLATRPVLALLVWATGVARAYDNPTEEDGR